jgi:hypothetical protein
MTIVSYVVGQKYFPIKYELSRIGAYFGVALVLFVISIYARFSNQIVRFSFNSVLFLVFLLFIWEKEKPDLKRLFQIKSK